MSAVSFSKINKYYDENHIVKDFNLDVRQGELIVLLGPSGCGKSTTLRMLAGLEDISSGSININGNCVNSLHPSDRDISMVFQSYALYPHMTVEQNIGFGLKMSGESKDSIKKRVNEVAEVLNLTPLLTRKPKALSGGQRQRVAMGRAMVRTPKVFLFDEPLSNLDAKLRAKMRTEIKDLHRKLNTTTLYVTHDQTEAMTLADRIVILNEGRIIQVGTPEEIYNSPINTFVATFVGHPEMNLVNIRSNQSLQNQIYDATRLQDIATIGIRPNNFITDKPSTPHIEIGGEVTNIELLGASYEIRVKTADNHIVAQFDTKDINLDTLKKEGIKLFVCLEHLNLFSGHGNNMKSALEANNENNH
ncbi:ABC transporter ATP-binding protein [Vibrio sp. WXL103]|uniref:ABC transporter ATP-binding protein n=1 Tax=Vibrio sp. WXL103 TaxID=3450710 RepID=UPI003EC7ADAE